MLEKCVLTILELNWKQRLGHKWTKLNICYHLRTSSTQLQNMQGISRRRKNENVFKMSKDEKCTCKACKNTIFHCQICKFVGFLLPSSSWLLKLPNFLLKRASFAQLTRAAQTRRQHKQRKSGAGALSVQIVDNFKTPTTHTRIVFLN